MPKSNSLKRNPIFVFGPPVALLSLGLSMIFQPNSFGSNQHELILDRIKAREESGWVVPQPALTDYLFPRHAIDQAGHEWVLINKTRPLNPIDFAPEDLRAVKTSDSLDNPRELRLTNAAATALEELAAEMSKAGAGKLFLNSAYRTFEFQSQLFEEMKERSGEEAALLRAAMPGYSEHQTGLAADVSVPEQGCAVMTCFGDTVGGIWLAENAWRFGYIVRYKEDTTAITGYIYEPWHIRFIGKPLAKLYHENGMNTLEELWGLPPAPNYPQLITTSTSD